MIGPAEFQPYLGWVGAGFFVIGLGGLVWLLFTAPKKRETESAPDISVSGNQNVVALNPVNSQTAHTIVNQAPKPEVIEGSLSVDGGVYRQKVEVRSPYPVREFIVVATGEGIENIEIQPPRSGAYMSGWSRRAGNRVFTSMMNAQGPYTIVVRKPTPGPIAFQYSVDEEIR